ncbi:hypothetical protein JCM8547_002507 [Rhodosporidiobolus lusitaniae]
MPPLSLSSSDDPPLESWDSDPDLDLPSGPLLLPGSTFSLQLPHLSVSAASLSSGAPSPALSTAAEESEGLEEGGEEGAVRESGFFEHFERTQDEEGEWERADGNESSMDSSRTSTTTGTLKGLMEGLSLDAENTLSFSSSSPSTEEVPSSPPSSLGPVHGTGDSTPRPPSKTTTLRASSSLSQLLALASPPRSLSSSPSSSSQGRGRGKVTHLGSTAPGAARDVGDGDWDQDLDLGDLDDGAEGGLPLPAVGRQVTKKGSFASHISLDSEDADFDFSDADEEGKPSSLSLSRPSLRLRTTTDSSHTGTEEDDDDDDLDFDLPPSTSHLTLSLTNRGSLASLRSEHVAPSSSSGAPSPLSSPMPAKATLPVSAAPSPATTATPGLSPAKFSRGEEDTSDSDDGETGGEDDDDDFFSDLVLPSYLGGLTSSSPPPGSSSSLLSTVPHTPPTSASEGEPSDSDPPSKSSPAHQQQQQQRKVDLQSLLRAKLEQRGGRGLLFHRSSSSGSISGLLEGGGEVESPSKEQERLAKHREEHVGGDDEGRQLASELARSGAGGGEKETKEGEEKWTAQEMRERMRTISGARAREAQREREERIAARRSGGTAGGGKGGGRMGMLRRTMSEGKVPPLPTSSSSFSTARRPGLVPSRSSTAAPTTSSRLARPASAQAQAGDRPSSALSNASSGGGAQPPQPGVRRGPPPAPSAASRDRVRMRTTSLRTVGSSSELRSGSTSSTTTAKRPGRLDVPAGAGGGGGARSLSPVPLTPTSPAPSSSAASTSSTTFSRPTLRPKGSQQHLSATSSSSSSLSSASVRNTLERKRSLQNLSASPSLPLHHPPPSSRPTSRQSSKRSPSPAGARGGFAAPTASSSSRIRERVQSNPSTPISSSSSTPAPSSASRLLRPTLASTSQSRPPPLSSLSRPNSPMKLPVSPSPSSSSLLPSHRTPTQVFRTSITLATPLSARRRTSSSSLLPRYTPLAAGAQQQKKKEQGPVEYGDGTELDAFDDLPVSKEREREATVFPSSASRKSSEASTATIKGGSWGRKDGASRLPVPVPAPRKPTTAGAVRGKKEGRKVEEKGKKVEEKGKVKKKRREPHLIRHLGGVASGVKVQGEMRYNPLLHRWEGNESILREFDVALATSTRPALISPFSSTLGSPARGSFAGPGSSSGDCTLGTGTGAGGGGAGAAPAKKEKDGEGNRLPPGASPGASRAGIKVVGDMVFDPKTCSWHALAGPEAEDELELDWGGGITSGTEGAEEEEGEKGREDGWEQGERERMLKNRASFVLEEGGSSEDGSAGEGSEVEGGEVKKGKQTKRRMWRESQRAEERCRGEMEGWIVRDGGETKEGGGEGRRWLWELRALIMDTR